MFVSLARWLEVTRTSRAMSISSSISKAAAACSTSRFAHGSSRAARCRRRRHHRSRASITDRSAGTRRDGSRARPRRERRHGLRTSGGNDAPDDGARRLRRARVPEGGAGRGQGGRAPAERAAPGADGARGGRGARPSGASGRVGRGGRRARPGAARVGRGSRRRRRPGEPRRLRARHYHRRVRAISLADCVAAEVARRVGSPLATSDPHLLDTCHAEGIAYVALPDTRGATWAPSP